MSDFGSTLRNLCGDRFLRSWKPSGIGAMRRYEFDDGTFVGYAAALRHAEELFFQSRQSTKEESV